ncbi:MAG TPA: Fe-S cluster protein, partial [Synergistaceae bacterium]|nr:Fe-S cluster protein [Synergistaceae bacterium]
MEHSIKVSKDACQGCVNCIRVCPTEAIRVVDGEIDIIEELCIDCGECLRSCCRSALGIYEDDWNRIKESSRAMIVPDPVFFSQFSHYGKPDDLEEVLISLDFKTLIDEAEDAFDLSAYAVAQLINRSSKTALPIISVYCPSVLRLIQTKFPELLSRVVPVLSPLEIAATLWRMRTNSDAPLTLLAPCPAKITMVREPFGKGASPLTSAVTVRKVARSIMAEGDINVEKGSAPRKRNNRWIQWARRGGESRHVQAFSDRKLTILAVSGMRNTLDTLQELELGRLRGVDFIECRVCDTGCVGGVGTADSRFLANLRMGSIET